MVRQLMVLSLLLCASGTPTLLARQVEVYGCAQKPTIDGVLDEDCWKSANWISGFSSLHSGKPLDRQTTEFQIIADPENLYIAVRCQDINNRPIRETPHDGPVWKGQSVEVFLSPAMGRYYHLAFNPLGDVYDSQCIEPPGGIIHHDPSWNPRLIVKTAITADGWSAELAIPWSELEIHDSKDDQWAINVIRNGDISSTFAPMVGSSHQPTSFVGMKIPSGLYDDQRWLVYAPERIDVFTRDGGGYRMHATNMLVRNHTGKHQHRKHIKIRLIDSDRKSILHEERTSTISVKHPARLDLEAPFERLGRYVLEVSVYDSASPKARLVHRSEQPIELAYEVLSVDITRPHYRNTIYATQKVGSIEGVVSAGLTDEQLAGATVELAFTALGKSSPVAADRLANLTPQTSFALEIPSLEPGRYVLSTNLADGRGELVKALQTEILVVEPAENEWRLDENNALLHNGKAVLPLGYFGTPHAAQMDLSAFCNVGITYNTAYESDERVIERLDDAQKHGSRMVLYPYPSGSVIRRVMDPDNSEPLSEADQQAIAARVRALGAHPGVMGWYMADEPRTVPAVKQRLQTVYQICKEVDPYHPCIFLHDREAGLRYFDGCGDVFMPDPYPYFVIDGHAQQPITLVTNHIQAARDAGRGRLGLWITPQGFSGQDYNANKTRDRAPNLTETRNMIYQAVVMGAKGVISYSLNNIRVYPELYYAYPHIYEELTLLAPFVLAADASLAACDDDSIHVTSRQVGDEIVIIAVNTSAAKVRPRINLAGVAMGVNEWTVMSEGRTIRPNASAIVDEFDIYATHVYTTSGVPEPAKELAQVEAAITADRQALIKPGNLAHRSTGAKISVDAKSPPYRAPYTSLNDGVIGRGRTWGALADPGGIDVRVEFAKAVSAWRVVIWGVRLGDKSLPSLFARREGWSAQIDLTRSELHDDRMVLEFAPVKASSIELRFDPKKPIDIFEIEIFEPGK